MEKEKKPIYKKWWFWLIIILIIGGIGAGTNENTTTISNQSNTSQEIVSNKQIYTITGQSIGEYGKKIILNENSDLPVEKYVYKLPAGKYSVTTSSNKIASFFIVKDEIAHTGPEQYPEELNYTSEEYFLTNGSNTLNGKAKKSVEITLNKDESISIISDDTIEFNSI